MKRQFVLFLVVSIGLIVVWLGFGSKVVAELNLAAPINMNQPDTRIVLTPTEISVSDEYLLEARQIVLHRLSNLQPSHRYNVILVDRQLEVILPKQENIEYVGDILARVGQVEFVDGGNEPPLGHFVTTTFQQPSTADTYQILFTGGEIISVALPESGQIFYRIIPNEAAAERVEHFVAAQTQSHICLVLDAQVINCSKLYVWTDGTLEIMPNLSSGTGFGLADLEVFLGSGPLPLGFEVAYD